MRFSPDPSTAALGSILTVSLVVEDFEAIGAFDISVAYDSTPGILEATALDLAGSVLESLDPIVIVSCVDGIGSACGASDGPGVLHLAAVGLSGETIPPTSGVLFNIRFDVVGVGSTTLDVFGDVLQNVSSDAIPHNTVDGSFSNAPLVPDYQVSLNVTSLGLFQDWARGVEVRVMGFGGFAGTVNLIIPEEALPQGVSYSLSVGSGTPSFMSILTITASPTATPQVSLVVVRAFNQTTMRTASFLLTVVRSNHLPVIALWNSDTRSGNVSSPSLQVGSQFWLAVNITGAADFDRYSFNIEYNPTVIQFIEASLEGTILWPSVDFQQISLLYPPGTVNVIVSSGRPVSGSGVLLFARFQVLREGLSMISVRDSALYFGGEPVAHRALGGCFNNRPYRSVTVDFTVDPSPGYYETSEYMLGKVAVGIVLPESIGPRRNWTDAEVSQVVNGVKAGMEWWASQVPEADLSFEYDERIRVPTIYEPADMSPSSDSLWISDVMSQLGYAGDAYSAVTAYNNDIRRNYGSDWAFTIFIVDSDFNVWFANSQIYAYAWIGGPQIVMLRYSSGAWNAASYYPAIPAHEAGHIFRATDEYDGASNYEGYLWVPDADNTNGIMNRNTLKASVSSLAQMGLVDCDADGIMDLLDTQPAVQLDPLTNITESSRVTGRTVAVPYPTYRPGGRDVTIGKIAQVVYSLDGAEPTLAVPVDGAFDEALEEFYFDLVGLSVGPHTVLVTVVTSAGNSKTVGLELDVMAGSAEFVKWKARPAYRHLDLYRVPEQIFAADVSVAGQPMYVYVLFRIIGRDGSTYSALSDVIRLETGEVRVFEVRWRPPSVSMAYDVQAILYYSPHSLPPDAFFWTVGGVKEFHFTVLG